MTTPPVEVSLDLRALNAAIRAGIKDTPPPGFARAITAAFRDVERGLRRWAASVTAAMRPVVPVITAAHNDPVRVAGLEARYQVRAGQDPRYTPALALDALVGHIMAGEDEDLRLLTPENRARVAAAAIRGWVDAHPGPLPVLTWHRLLGDTVVVVRRG